MTAAPAGSVPGALLIGTRDGFGLEFHLERDRQLLCVDVFVGGLHVNAWDDAFYPPLLVKKLEGELRRFGAPPEPPPEGFTSAPESFRAAERWMHEGEGEGDGFARYEFLEWGECTDQVTAFAFPDGESVHLAARVREVGGGEGEPVVVSVGRGELVETLERGLAVAGREWAARLAVPADRSGTGSD
ncbi:hypothetical protein ACIA8O_22555 [Kitasatospora sp. NPDC051853]|uniref:hypothetical protein n=1 Tax=Kitasatospora sp. NPDC051853 TaxID=3364058 RepID=UPI0037A42406